MCPSHTHHTGVSHAYSHSHPCICSCVLTHTCTHKDICRRSLPHSYTTHCQTHWFAHAHTTHITHSCSVTHTHGKQTHLHTQTYTHTPHTTCPLTHTHKHTHSHIYLHTLTHTLAHPHTCLLTHTPFSSHGEKKLNRKLVSRGIPTMVLCSSAFLAVQRGGGASDDIYLAFYFSVCGFTISLTLTPSRHLKGCVEARLSESGEGEKGWKEGLVSGA